MTDAGDVGFLETDDVVSVLSALLGHIPLRDEMLVDWSCVCLHAEAGALTGYRR